MNQKVRPENRKEFMNKLVVPYDVHTGNPNTVFSDPVKLGQPENNRAKQISLKNNTDKDFHVSLTDLSEAVRYYFDNILKLSVVQNNTKVNVPVLYATPEAWSTVQKDGYYRDKTGKLMAPLVMFKRTNTTPNRALGNKLDGNSVHNLQLFEKQYSKRNYYSNFNVLNSRSPEKEYVVSITPDYVFVEYECLIWTYTVEQMDKLVEALNFASRSYWGDPNRFQFYSQIEAFSDSVTYDIGDDRAVKSSFTLTLNGYLIPDTVNKSLANANLVYGASQILFGMEVAANDEQQHANMTKIEPKKISRILAADSVNNTFITSVDPSIYAYIMLNVQCVGTYVNNTTVTFNRPWAVAPSSLPANNVSNFSFFVNGQYVEPTAIVSFTTTSTTSTLVIDPSILQYSLEPTDLIISSGKFK